MNFFGTIEEFDVAFNPESWGPVSGKKMTAFEDMPYAHFDKKEKTNRIADFGTGSFQHQQRPRFRREDMSNADFVYKHDAAEDSTFQLVDSAKTVTKKNAGPKRNWGQQGRGGQGGRGQGGRFGARGVGGQRDSAGGFGRNQGQSNQRGAKGGFGNRRGMRRDRNKDRNPSLSVLPEWDMVDEFDFTQLLKLVANPPKVEDLSWCGYVDQYDDSYDKISSRTARTLKRIDNKIFYGHVTTSDDPNIGNYAAAGSAEFFATDAILAQLMAAPRSVYSWDLVIQKFNGMIFFDKRDNSTFDYLTVSETARDPPTASDDVDEFNQPTKLSLEATMINQNFSQQILKEDPELRKTFEPNPFHENDEEGLEPASTAYRYRKFVLGEHTLIARCEVHCWLHKNEDQMLTTYALNEWDSKFCDGVSWRQKIDQQRGAVLATELKNNSCKLAKWTAQSIIAGADQMRVGYVSRVNPREPNEHVVLATQFFKPKELATQINLSLNNAWGIIKTLFEILKQKEDGKYVLLKDPNKPTLRLYSVPPNTFEDEDEEDEGADSGAEVGTPVDAEAAAGADAAAGATA